MNKRKLLANVMFGRFNPIFRYMFGNRRSQLFYVLAYHRVFQSPGSGYPFNEGIISTTPEEFDKQMCFLSKKFNVINFLFLSDILSSRRSVPENTLIITFDDGYSDNYEIALEVLKKYGLTATVFVSTGFIGSGIPFWFDEVSHWIKRMSPGIFILDSVNYMFEVTDNNRREVRKELGQLLKRLSDKNRLSILRELEEKTKIRIEPDDIKLAKPLNWSQIKEMSDEGIEIGSHTVNHPFLANMTGEEMRFELGESKRNIEERIGTKIISIAYPGGSYDQRVIECAKSCGYLFGISYEHKVKRITKSGCFNIPRIHVEMDIDFSLFQACLLLPELFVNL